MTVIPTGVRFHLVVESAICYIFKQLISSFKKGERGKKLWICCQRRKISWTKLFPSSRPAAPQVSEPYSPTPYSNTSMKAESCLKSTVCLSVCSQILLFLPRLSSAAFTDILQGVRTADMHMCLPALQKPAPVLGRHQPKSSPSPKEQVSLHPGSQKWSGSSPHSLEMDSHSHFIFSKLLAWGEKLPHGNPPS